MDDKMQEAFNARFLVADEAVFWAREGVEWTLDYLRSRQEPVAWFDDGTIRSGSESTAYRVVSDATKQDMPRAAAISFNSPLYARPVPSVHVVPEWQPIETAPKDQLIDLLVEGGRRYAGCHSDTLGEWRHTTACGRLIWFKNATHWMPIPAAPSPDKEKPHD